MYPIHSEQFLSEQSVAQGKRGANFDYWLDEDTVSTGLRLGEYAVTPLYNIKAVVQATSISPSTLRAWERRYNIARPQRSDSGYRLYSERDITVIRWLKTQVDAGMSISQAVSWLGKLISEAGTMEQATLPTAGSGALLHDQTAVLPASYRGKVRDLEILQRELIQTLTNFDEDGADAAIAEAFSIYPVEQVGDKLIIPFLQEISIRQQRGELSITAERFAGHYLSQRLGTLLRLTPNSATGARIWVGSACTGASDAGASLFAIYLRRTGYHVNYLGPNLSSDEENVKDLSHEASRRQLDMILLSATARATAEDVAQLTRQLHQNKLQSTIIAFAGEIYGRNSELRAATPGVYVGAYAKEIVENIGGLLAERAHFDRKYDSGKTHSKKVDNGRSALTKRWQQL